MAEITPQAVNERVDNMAEWADGVNDKLTQIQERLAPDVEHADAIVESMMEAEAIQKAREADMATIQMEMASLRADISDQTDSVKEAQAEALMFAEGGNAGKRKAVAALALKDNAEYQEQKAALAINNRAKLIKQAHFESAEREYKRLGEQLRNLRSRLEHWTARAKLSQGE